MTEQAEDKTLAKLQGKVVDVEEATVDELNTLAKYIKQQRKIRIRRNAHNLLLKELGEEDYRKFIKEGEISIEGNNGMRYVVHVNGYVEAFNGQEFEEDGQLIRNGYPAEDAIVTFIKYARLNAEGLE